MDTSRKILINKCCCHFCMNYQPQYKNSIKLCRGICRVTGTYKQRTDKCKKYFKEGLQIRLLEE
ncbi:hypothetical protein LF65_06155 [Clostridium beijerinckii]|uniref:Uncharacterized protein n=1 Tax=Clostridium beijerinckii TaxID=1520 RepID=A0A140DMB1_CLOBE|nr:hypothetical protein LF65_06155 [Clostridium beijerinckii]